ncbi:MAG: 1-deoxy-D-xylulose-5-phosphate synthase [Phycisphaerae bacterium]|nr:1-deoxy-D-xylulose-5-phosphate synthase [Phycisphaerae bacterium]
MDKFLETINGPDDLKKLDIEQLTALAAEVREFILESVSRTGGHLASNLGVVELTLAMHYVFDFKSDKLLWDVGHQCYTHKIITGRRQQFTRLREADGISGFPNPAESPYDQFTVGHAGTAIPTAVGMALGLQKSTEKIVALVGDASIVNGVSFEGMNNMGLVKRQMLVVLNDNSMAIDATQGALAKYFSKMRLSHTYEDMVRTTSNILEHLPVVGKSMEEAIERFKKTIRMTQPASQLFESLNIPFFGPVDGHDIESLIELFKAAAHLQRPAILHVYTKKGKGFSPAGDHPAKFHSTGPFEVNGDEVEHQSSAGKSFTQVFGECLVKLAEKDQRIVAITSAMTDGTGLAEFREKFPDRFYDVGIAESAAVDIAAGMAKAGKIPVVCIYSTFLQRSFDQIFQEVSLQGLHVIFCIDRAGLVGSDGPTHHGLMDIGFFRMMPNMSLAAPADGRELALALEWAINADGGIAIRYPKETAGDNIGGCEVPFETGKSVTVKGTDSDIAIVTYGAVLRQALAAAVTLEKEGMNVDVINARFASPVDDKILALYESRKAVITVEDHRQACGFGSAVLEAAANKNKGRINAKVINLAAPKEFIRHDTRAKQINAVGIDLQCIIRTVKELSLSFRGA